FVPARLRGFANLVTDPWNGTVRAIYPGRLGDDGVFIPGIVSALAGKLGYPPAHAELPVAWHGRPDAGIEPFRMFPAQLVPSLPATWLKDKIILIGADLAHTDRHRTPFAAGLPGGGGYLPGILVHAHTLAQLMEERRSVRLGEINEIMLIIVFAATGALLGHLALPLGRRILASTLFIGMLWLSGLIIFNINGFLMPLLSPTLAFAISQWLSDAYSSGEANRQRRFIKEAFGRYLSPSLVEQLLRYPGRLELGGERRYITILFTDIAGFTDLAERIEPATLSRLMNTYFEGVCGAVLAHGGMVNEFIGDAVLALFGAPITLADHAKRAIACARDIDSFSERFRNDCAANGIKFGETRIGMHTGDVMVGNFGSTTRFKYGAMGDAVNTASRIEGLNKHVAGRVMASGVTIADADETGARPVGDFLLKGRHRPLPVFDLTPNGDADALAAYRAAFSLLQNGGTEAARSAFEKLAIMFPGDPLIAFQLTRLRTGVISALVVMTEK
ncbi:MAG: adenylate/guanylate cyclase domain-containing protein, partial [Rhodospirillaceae bacterium]